MSLDRLTLASPAWDSSCEGSCKSAEGGGGTSFWIPWYPQLFVYSKTEVGSKDPPSGFSSAERGSSWTHQYLQNSVVRDGGRIPSPVQTPLLTASSHLLHQSVSVWSSATPYSVHLPFPLPETLRRCHHHAFTKSLELGGVWSHFKKVGKQTQTGMVCPRSYLDYLKCVTVQGSGQGLSFWLVSNIAAGWLDIWMSKLRRTFQRSRLSSIVSTVPRLRGNTGTVAVNFKEFSHFFCASK